MTKRERAILVGGAPARQMKKVLGTRPGSETDEGGENESSRWRKQRGGTTQRPHTTVSKEMGAKKNLLSRGAVDSPPCITC